MADDRGLYVTAKRKWLSKSHPGRYDVLSWDDVVAYEVGVPVADQFAGSTINAHHCVLTIRTRDNVHAFDLPIPQSLLMNKIGQWLAKVPQ